MIAVPLLRLLASEGASIMIRPLRPAHPWQSGPGQDGGAALPATPVGGRSKGLGGRAARRPALHPLDRTSLQLAHLFDHLVDALPERRYLNLIRSVRLSVEALGFKGSFVAFALF
jgi:hypothetical protein